MAFFRVEKRFSGKSGVNQTLLKELKEYGIQVDVYDPWVDPKEAEHEYGITPVAQPEKDSYDAMILAVSHNQFKDMGAANIRALGKKDHILYDLKYLLPAEDSDIRL
jgi:UDP-N-acetyl-D-galactosamine dehydrogenase